MKIIEICVKEIENNCTSQFYLSVFAIYKDQKYSEVNVHF
ncbi:unnamed protein product [Paramecium octaurelia]|uniref:Uncharacterized protein n=1 Tax=Paramecium octaurelia TaxID=43137 RepID=A0A8S1VLM5_PAROT|nr:unnamed protein product [Paramecium octaurelia]